MCSSLIGSRGAYTGPVRRGLVLLGLVLALGALAAPAGASGSQFFRIQYVIDGDTVVLANGLHVRLVQIDTPELRGDECYGAQARALLRRLIPPGTTVRVEADRRLDQVDRYGRLLRYLFRGPTNLNLELGSRPPSPRAPPTVACGAPAHERRSIPTTRPTPARRLGP